MVSFLLLTCAAVMLTVATPEATEAAWARLASGGYSVLLPHADAVSTNDPANFEIDDCSTQSGLSGTGRTEAQRQGTRFAVRAVAISAVYTSRYCRAIDTARLAFGSQQIEPVAELDRLTGVPTADEERLAQTVARINGFSGPGNQILVTHPENIEALTGTVPRSGEAIVMAPTREDGERPEVVGRILLN